MPLLPANASTRSFNFCPGRKVTTVRAEIEAGNLELDGDPAVANSMHRWLGLSPFAVQTRRVA